METETTWSEFPDGGNATVEHILGSRYYQTQKSKPVQATVRKVTEKLHIWEKLFEIEKLYQNSPGLDKPE